MISEWGQGRVPSFPWPHPPIIRACAHGWKIRLVCETRVGSSLGRPCTDSGGNLDQIIRGYLLAVYRYTYIISMLKHIHTCMYMYIHVYTAIYEVYTHVFYDCTAVWVMVAGDSMFMSSSIVVSCLLFLSSDSNPKDLKFLGECVPIVPVSYH